MRIAACTALFIEAARAYATALCVLALHLQRLYAQPRIAHASGSAAIFCWQVPPPETRLNIISPFGDALRRATLSSPLARRLTGIFFLRGRRRRCLLLYDGILLALGLSAMYS